MGNCSTCTCTDKNEVQNFEVQVGGDTTANSGKTQRVSNSSDATNNGYGGANGPRKNNNGGRKVCDILID